MPWRVGLIQTQQSDSKRKWNPFAIFHPQAISPATLGHRLGFVVFVGANFSSICPPIPSPIPHSRVFMPRTRNFPSKILAKSFLYTSSSSVTAWISIRKRKTHRVLKLARKDVPLLKKICGNSHWPCLQLSPQKTELKTFFLDVGQSRKRNPRQSAPRTGGLGVTLSSFLVSNIVHRVAFNNTSNVTPWWKLHVPFLQNMFSAMPESS